MLELCRYSSWPHCNVAQLTGAPVYRIPIPFINELDTKPLPPLHYTTKRICYPGVNINTNNDYMICCDCTDDCQDKSKCACCLLTAEVSRTKDFYGYTIYRMLSSTRPKYLHKLNLCHKWLMTGTHMPLQIYGHNMT